MRRGSGYGITVLRVTLGIIFLLHGYLAQALERAGRSILGPL